MRLNLLVTHYFQPKNLAQNWSSLVIPGIADNDGAKYQAIAEELVADIRTCPPAAGFEQVEIPGERERDLQTRQASQGIAAPENTWQQIVALARELGVA